MRHNRTLSPTIIDVKFDEESQSKLRIGVPRIGKPENAENYEKS